jgi:hypothetical protein
MNIRICNPNKGLSSSRIKNADNQNGRIANPTERKEELWTIMSDSAT